MTKAIHSD